MGEIPYVFYSSLESPVIACTLLERTRRFLPFRQSSPDVGNESSRNRRPKCHASYLFPQMAPRNYRVPQNPFLPILRNSAEGRSFWQELRSLEPARSLTRGFPARMTAST